MAEAPIPLPRRTLTSPQKKPIPAPRFYTTENKQNESDENCNDTTKHETSEYDPNVTLENNESNFDASQTPIVSVQTVVIEEAEKNEVLDTRSSNPDNFHVPPRKSVVLEFDPLLSADLSSDDGSMPLTGSLDSIPSEPPTPPERVDSLPEDSFTVITSINGTLPRSESSTNWFIDNEDNKTEETHTKKTPAPSASSLVHPASFVKRISKAFMSDQGNKEIICSKPSLRETFPPPYSGMLKVQRNQRYAALSGGCMTCYAGTTLANVKESYNLSEICSLQVVLEGSGSEECIEMSLLSGIGTSYSKTRLTCSTGERCIWMQRLIEHLTNGFKQRDASKCTRFGWCFIKTGVCSQWQGAWLMLVERNLLYFTPTCTEATSLDLRKLQLLSFKQIGDSNSDNYPSPRSDRLQLLDFPDQSLYIIAPRKQECKIWSDLIALKRKGGSRLNEQQLTANDVPVIVQKCINFIYTHGSFSEGIYRRAGATSTVTSLLAAFRKDAHAVSLQKSEHSEHDVATVLKKFLRDLPEPLIDCREALLGAKEITNEENRLIAYKKAMSHMNAIRRATVQRLFAHLNCVHSANDRNRMSAANLAAVWSQTLMPAEKEGEWGITEAEIIRELIEAYASIWNGSLSEIMRERRLKEALIKHHSNTSLACKQAGDLIVWIHLLKHNQDSQQAVTLSPNKTCSDICEELSSKTPFPSHKLMVEEIILQGALTRWMVGVESPLETVARWGYWPEKHRKDNYLIVKDDTPLRLLETLKDDVIGGVSGTLKYVSPKMKSFREHPFELKDGILNRYSNDGKKVEVDYWRVDELVWYSGFEAGRDPVGSWAITFITAKQTVLHSANSSESEISYFGHTISGDGDENELLNWLAAFAFTKYKSVVTEQKLIEI